MSQQQQHFSPPFSEEYQQAPAWPERLRLWFKHRVLLEREAAPQSGYLTLIPLNDARLQPRRTALLVTVLLFFALAVGLSVFFLVPRGITAGDIELQSDRMSWNITRGSYQLMLRARIPIYNPNYLDAKVVGQLHVFFYDSEAGVESIEALKIPARSSPYVIEVTVDASKVPNQYALAILSECMTFPRRLVFFLKGYLTAHLTTSGESRIESLDQAFLIDCINGNVDAMRTLTDESRQLAASPALIQGNSSLRS